MSYWYFLLNLSDRCTGRRDFKSSGRKRFFKSLPAASVLIQLWFMLGRFSQPRVSLFFF